MLSAASPNAIAAMYRAQTVAGVGPNRAPASDPFAFMDRGRPSVGGWPDDTVDLSPEALSGSRMEANGLQGLLDTFRPLYGGQRGDGFKSLFEVGQDFAADFKSFTGMLGQALSMAGLGASEPLTFAPDGKGHVRVEGEHPDAAPANEMFEGNKTMVSRFMVVAARAALMDMGTDPGFAQAYDQDPAKTIESHEEDLKGRLLGFRLTAFQATFTTSFVRADGAGAQEADPVESHSEESEAPAAKRDKLDEPAPPTAIV